jgi:hypothetical protein
LTEVIALDLNQIEAVEVEKATLTAENTRLTSENAALTSKNIEQHTIINDVTIPTMITKLGQYANKITDGELKTNLTELKTALTSLKDTQISLEKSLKETQEKAANKPASTNYFGIGAVILGSISVLLTLYHTFFKASQAKQEER